MSHDPETMFGPSVSVNCRHFTFICDIVAE